MTALLESLASTFDGDAAHRAALDAALRGGLPGPRSEAWKYTSLRSLERRVFAAASAPRIDATALVHVPAPRLVFVNGQFDHELSDLSGLGAGVTLRALSTSAPEVPGEEVPDPALRTDPADHVFARLNTALAREGAVLGIEAGMHLDMPIHLAFVGAAVGADVAWHACHRLELGAGASARVVEHHFAVSDHAHLGNELTRIELGAGARLAHARVQDAAAKATLLTRTDAVLASGAHYRRIDLELGAGLSRHELNVRLEGEGARVHANGVLFADGRRQLDTRLGIEHLARDTACELTWRGLASGRGRAAFHGGITIRAGADGSDANLSNKNLLLSADAEIDTQPVLEIHADEVKAAHGATVGQLDPTALFYLRSRGLPKQQARRLLTLAFTREVVAGAADGALRSWLEERIGAALARLGEA